MSFLRSIIKDARSGRSIADQGARYQLTPRSQMEGMSNDIADVKPEPAVSHSHANFADTSGLNQNSGGDINVADISDVQEVNSVNPEMHHSAGHQQDNEQKSKHNISVQTDVANSLEHSTTASDIGSSLEPFNSLTEMQDVQHRGPDVEPIEMEQTSSTDEHSVFDTAEAFKPFDELETQPISVVENLPEQYESEKANDFGGQQTPDQLDTAAEIDLTQSAKGHGPELHQPAAQLMTSRSSTEFSRKTSPEKRLPSTDVNVNEKSDSLNGPLLSDSLEPDRKTNTESNHFNSLNHSTVISGKDGLDIPMPPGVKKPQKMQSLSDQIDVPASGKQVESKTGYHEMYSLADTQEISKQLQHSTFKPVINKPAVSSGNPGPEKSMSTGARHDPTRQETIPSVPAKLFRTDSMPAAIDNRHSRSSTRQQDKRHEIATVQIGQIDVIIEMPAKPASKPTAVSSSSDLSSRHYLRSL